MPFQIIVQPMRQTPKFMIRNTRSTPHTRAQSRQESPLRSPFEPSNQSFREEQASSIEARAAKLEGNLKLLEKKYRDNLKEGFQNKIKSYRLQAVVQRKLLRQAIEQTEKDRQLRQLQEKIERNQALRRMSQERALITHYQQQEKQNYRKRRDLRERRKMSLTMYVRNKQEEAVSKLTHDRILWEEQHSDRKKNYFIQLRQESQQKQMMEHKRELLHRVVTNTLQLKQLKAVLEDFQKVDSYHPFLTL